MIKRIILFYEHINREYDACMKLKNAIENSNSKYYVYVYSIQFEYFKALKICKKYKINMVIMPWLYNDNDYVLVQPFIKKNPNVYILNLHHEQIAYEASENILLPSGENAKNSVIHLVWGEFFKRKLLSQKVQKELIYITGNIRTDRTFQASLNRKELSQEFELDLSKRWILFSENRSWVLSHSQKKDEVLINMGFAKQDVEERTKITKNSLVQTIRELDETSNDFFDKYELIYRPHPGTQAPKNLNKRVKVIDKYSIYEWINSIDINVVWTSTTIFESDIKGIPSIVYEPIEYPNKFKNYGLENYPTITSFNEINEEIIELYKTEVAPKKIYEGYIGKVDGKSTERTSDIILKILCEGIDGYSASVITYRKSSIAIRYLFDRITRLFVKLGIFEIVKYPNSAYQLKNDIPYLKKDKAH